MSRIGTRSNLLTPFRAEQKEVGAWNYLQYMEGLEGFFLALFTRVLDYTPEEVKLFMDQVRKDSKDPKIHAMYHL